MKAGQRFVEYGFFNRSQNNIMNNKNNNMYKMANFSFLTNAHTSSFSRDTYQSTYNTCKESPESCFQFVDAFKAGFMCVFYQDFCENMGDPYYKPIIVVHD